MADVFISYRNLPERRAYARRLATILRAHSVEVWWDFGLAEGESYRQQITDELGKARVVVPLWCAESVLSKWVVMEAELGKDKLLPVRLQNVAPPDAFEGIHAADLIGWDGTVGHPRLQAFVRRLCERLGKPGTAPADTLEELAQPPALAPLPVVRQVQAVQTLVSPQPGQRGVPWAWIGATAGGVLAATWLGAYLAGMPVGGPVGKTGVETGVGQGPTVNGAATTAAPDNGPRRVVAVPSANGMVKYTLPSGTVIEANKDGVEAKLIAFIANKDAEIDRKLWFDFDRLTFVTGSSDLTPQSKAQVASAVAILKAYPAAAIKLAGYTDNQGDPDANLKLSDTRAQSVMAALVAGGVAADRIEAKGYGDQFPIGDNGTPEGRAKNRRIALNVRAK